MKKISIFIANLEGGGAERMACNIANEISKRHPVDLVLMKKSGPYLNRVNPAVNIVNLKTSFLSPFSFIKLALYLRKTRPLVLLSLMTYPNIISLLAKKISCISTRMIISERVVMTVQSSKSTSLKEKLKPVLAARFYPSANHVIAISKGVADDLVAHIGVKKDCVTVIYNPVLQSGALPEYPKPDHPWFKNGQQQVILAIGRLVPQKDFATLMHAFAQLHRLVPAKLVILGEGPERNNLTLLAEQLNIIDNVYMPGFVEEPNPFMQHASVFVMSSAWEGFGNVLVEAMACGCPVVSTDCPSGPSEILAHGDYGILVPVKDQEALAKAIMKTLKNPPPPDTLKQRAQDFSVEKNTEKYLDILLNNQE